MALRLRRDVQKASYYVWFLGAEEAKGLRGARVINSALPYLIDRSRGQEPLKVTLQVSHKGIKILQGSSKHFIPHSAITSSVQTDDIVACVLLLYNPATKCPLHVHAYRCDSESTAEALQQQLQILINRPENQKRFEELETRLGILPPLPTTGGKSTSSSTAHINAEHSQKQQQSQHQQQPQQHHYLSQQQQQQQQQQRRHETSPKRFSSSLGSDTGNSTRESECSEEHLGVGGNSPLSRSPPIGVKPLPLPVAQQNNELFDSLAAELRAKLNGNGPPLLLPPRDYDTVHRSKGNLTAIELRRCRNALIVGGATPNTTTMANSAATAQTVPTTANNGKQVSSRGSSGIGSDLAPSPERQELNSSSDDEHWSNEADNSVIALKPSQIALERSAPNIIPHHPQLNRKSAMQTPEDSYLRDLPAKPYVPRHGSGNNSSSKVSSGATGSAHERDPRSKTPSAGTWSREDEIKPIIMRPADYDAKFNRVLQAEQKHDYKQHNGRRGEVAPEHAKLHDTDKYNEINRLLSKKLSLERDAPADPMRYKQKIIRDEHDDLEADDFDDSDPASDHVVPAPTANYHQHRKENLTDKQKFLEYNSKKQPKVFAADAEAHRYGGRHRYVDPADLPFEVTPPVAHNKYAAVHRGAQASSPERSDLGHRTAERQRDRQRVQPSAEEVDAARPARRNSRERERERGNFSRSNERNPYREPESIPYIQSMEKMMKSSAMRYKSFDGVAAEPKEEAPRVPEHAKVSQRKSFPKQQEPEEEPHKYTRAGRSDYAPSVHSSVTPKDRFKDAKNKFHAMERTGSRYDLVADEKDGLTNYSNKSRHHHTSVEAVDKTRAVYDDWSDEEDQSPPPPPISARSRSRSRDDWEREQLQQQQHSSMSMSSREMVMPPRGEPQRIRERDPRDPRDHHFEYTREMRAPREKSSGKRSNEPPRDKRDHSRDMLDGRDVRDVRDVREVRDARDVRDVREVRDAYHRYDQPPTRNVISRESTHATREHQRGAAVEHSRDHSRDYGREHGRRNYSPDARSGSDHRSDYIASSNGTGRSMEKHRVPHQHPDMYAAPTPPPHSGGGGPTAGAPIASSKSLSNLAKGYRHSYAEPVFARTGGRVGLAAVNPY